MKSGDEKRGLAVIDDPVEGLKPLAEFASSERVYVEMIFRKMLELKRLNHVLHYLNENGYKTKEFLTKSGKKSGGNRWTISSLHSILTNRSYIGEREINKRFRTMSPDKVKDEDRYFFVDAHWPELISKELFFDVQRLLEQNRKNARKYIHQYRFTGLIECSECGAKMVGKSGSGRTSKYFYYGHKRKVVVSNDRHLHRCRVENVPALQLEEAVVARLKDLASDRELVAELARTTVSDSKDKLEHKKSLIAAKEQERRKFDQMVKNLEDAIAEESDKESRAGLSQKLKSTRLNLEQAQLCLAGLKEEYAQANNVVDVSEAMEFLREFRDGAFEAQPVGVQTEMLKCRIRRMIVKENQVYIEIFGRKPEPVLRLLGSEGPEIKNPTLVAPGSTRSENRTVFKLVGATGFEPATFCTPSKCSTRLSHAPTACET